MYTLPVFGASQLSPCVQCLVSHTIAIFFAAKVYIAQLTLITSCCNIHTLLSLDSAAWTIVLLFGTLIRTSTARHYHFYWKHVEIM